VKKILFVMLFLASCVIAEGSYGMNATYLESKVGGELGNMIGSATYCYGDKCLDVGPLLITVFILAFFFIWSSVSGIAWDGVFFLLFMILAIQSTSSGFLGSVGQSLVSLVFAIIMMGIFYRTILRRG
jgi:hypothetical protein